MCDGSGKKQQRGDNEVQGSKARIAPKEANKRRESDERNDERYVACAVRRIWKSKRKERSVEILDFPIIRSHTK